MKGECTQPTDLATPWPGRDDQDTWFDLIPSSFLIRPFAPADQASARALILEGLGEHFGQVNAAFNPDLDDIAGSYLAPGHTFLVAEAGGILLGTGALRAERAEGQIVRVSVRRDRRGRGIGRALVMALLEAARTRGLDRVWVETNDDWRAAIGLYHHCGFRESDRRDGCTFMELGSEFLEST